MFGFSKSCRISQDNALDILKALKQIPISLETLQKTRIGMSVNNVRKQTKNEEVASAAKQLIKGWKKLVSGFMVNYIILVLIMPRF